MVYGRAALPGEHELRVAYPFYSAILFFPFALIQEFDVARAVWMTILEIGLISLTLVSIQLTTWRPKIMGFGTIVVFLTSLVPRSAIIDQWKCRDPHRFGDRGSFSCH